MTHPVIADVTTNIAEYLKTPNVGCVGGSWLTPAECRRTQRLGPDLQPGHGRRRTRRPYDTKV